MTWWEAEQMADYIAKLERALDEWTLSGPQMHREQGAIDNLETKIQKALDRAEGEDKKVFLIQLAGRVESLRQHLTERLKRNVQSRS